MLAAKVRALLEGRYNVSFEDIRQVYLPALRHRILLNFEAQAENIAVRQGAGAGAGGSQGKARGGRHPRSGLIPINPAQSQIVCGSRWERRDGGRGVGFLANFA